MSKLFKIHQKAVQVLSAGVIAATVFSPTAFRLFESLMGCEGVPAIC